MNTQAQSESRLWCWSNIQLPPSSPQVMPPVSHHSLLVMGACQTKWQSLPWRAHGIRKQTQITQKKNHVKKSPNPQQLVVVSSARAWSHSQLCHWDVSLRVQGEMEEGHVYRNWALSFYTHLFINSHPLEKNPTNHCRVAGWQLLITSWLIFLLDALLLMCLSFKIQHQVWCYQLFRTLCL